MHILAFLHRFKIVESHHLFNEAAQGARVDFAPQDTICLLLGLCFGTTSFEGSFRIGGVYASCTRSFRQIIVDCYNGLSQLLY